MGKYYPYRFVQQDALEALRRLIKAGPGQVSAVHASPPCQAYSQNNNWTRGELRPDYPDLVEPTRELLLQLGLPYVMENVEGSPLRPDVRLCGTAFGLPLKRHRIFESNVPLGEPPGCNHWSHTGEADLWRIEAGDTSQGDLFREKGEFCSPSGRPNREKGTLDEWLVAMECSWMTRAGVVQAIPPAYTCWLGERLLRVIPGTCPAV